MAYSSEWWVKVSGKQSAMRFGYFITGARSIKVAP